MITQEQQQKLLGALLKKPQNLLCADCSSKSPCWASLDFGVFVCMNCSGAHRSLGQSVTRIKSTKLDTWNKDWLWHMQLNNKLINQYYEHSYNAIMNRKPNPNSSLNQIKKFVYDKYVRKLFAQEGQDDPITNLKNGKPPLKVSSSQSDKATKFNVKVENQPKLPPKSVATQSIQVKQIKKAKNLLDDASSDTNRTPSQNNDKIRQQVNLFEEDNSEKKKSCSPNPHHNIYNKEHYNSFSGIGAKHSSTGPVSFQTLFSHPTPQINPSLHNTNFDQFKQLTNVAKVQGINPVTLPISGNSYNYAHHNSYNYPNAHSNSYHYAYGGTPGTAFQGHIHTTNQHPTHVTMNINMNMYSNVMNINLNENPANLLPQKQSNITDHYKLDINDFSIKNQQQKITKEKNQKSWVDDWK